ncbi:hypothetical protein OROHE_007826 [Orobanche hederae]
MGHKIAHILFSSLLILSCFLAQTSGKRQTEALSQFYNKKLILTDIDRSPFNAIHNLNEAQILSQEGLKESDRIERLPGQPEVNFEQYGGYVTVDQTSGRALYYYFVEAQHSENTLPLLLWFNGGPGCSSFGYGAMMELGPFRVNSDGETLYKNNFAWNYAANVLFFETPAGVGFSYSNKTNDTSKSGDKRTASDNYIFLLNWLERFPEYKERDIYIAGESYAGHYVPQLAHTILLHNGQAKNTTTIINLKGIIIGNAVIDDETDTKGMYNYFASHALISDDTANQALKYCTNIQSNKCIEADAEVGNEIGHINIYNIYAPLCFDDYKIIEPKKKNTSTSEVSNFDPCSDSYVYAYLNRPDVQNALHANVTKIPYEWQHCSYVIKTWEDSPSTVIPLLKEFMSIGLRVWIYSGDVDARIPVTSTRLSIKRMKLDIKTSWYPWYLSREVGGYATVYINNLTFVTIRGAGHEAPSYQPARALSMIMHFVAGTDLPNS